MATLYDVITGIRKDIFEGKKDIKENVVKALDAENIKLRGDDGALQQISVSIPKSIEDSYYLGLRYIKRDNSYTEDGILFRNDGTVERFYKGKQEKSLPEYKGTHKEQITGNESLDQGAKPLNYTFVNTVTFYVDD